MRNWTAVLVAVWPLWGQSPPVITTIAGTDYVFPGDGAEANSAPLGRITGVAVDGQGSVLLTDADNSIVARVDARGVLRVAGGNGFREISGDGGPARSAAIRFASRVTADAAGNAYFVDDHVVRRISTDGIITTVAGGGTSEAENIVATTARLLEPSGVAVAANGNIYLADRQKQRVFVVAGGMLRTFATGLREPRGIALDREGANLFLCETGEDGSGRIRRIPVAQGTAVTVAGGGLLTADDSPALQYQLLRPESLAIAAAGDVFIADESAGLVLRLSGGRVRRVAGGDGRTVIVPNSVAVDAAGNVYIGEVDPRRVRRLDRGGTLSTFAGSGQFRLSGDGGPALSATLNEPARLALGPQGDVYFNDSSNGRVRRISPAGIVTTLASGFDAAFGLTADRAGNVYVSDADRIRRITPAGAVTVFAGGGENTGENVDAREALVDFTAALAFDSAGNLYLAEYGRNRVRRVGVDGRIRTVAGTGVEGSSGDGGPAVQATLDDPRGLALDAAGNLYISESNGNRVRRVGTDGIITTYAGGGNSHADGVPAAQAFLESPGGMTVDGAGNLYLAEAGGARVRRVSPGRTITTVAGNGLYEFSGDGGPATAAALNQPADVALDAAGNLLIADTANHRIRKVFLTQTPTFRAAPLTLSFAAQSGGAAPAEQVVALSADAPLGYQARAATATGGNWLSATPASGSAPAALRVSVNPAALAPGEYQGTITVDAAGGTPPSVTIRVTASIAPAAAPRIVAEPAQLEFEFLPGDGAASRQVRVSNRGSGSVAAAVAVSGPGLSIAPSAVTATAAAPALVTVTATPEGLAAGTYRGSVTITPEVGAAVTLPVTIVVGRARRSLLLSQTGLSFVAVAGSPGTAPPQQVAVLNAGDGSLAFTAAASVLGSTPQWLSVSPGDGVAVAGSPRVTFLDVRVDAAGLAPDAYFGLVRVDAGEADNSPQFISVSLTVLPAGSRPPPIVRPTGLVFVGEEAVSPGSQDLTVSNLTAEAVSFISGRTPEPPNALFTALPPQGTVQPGTPFRVAIQPGYTNLTRGIRQATLTLDFSDGSFQTVRVLLVVTPRAGTAAVRSAHSNCTAASLQSEFTIVPRGFSAVAGLPLPIEARVVDDCGHSLSAGAVTASFSNGDAPVALVHVQDGRWSGTYTPKNAAAGPLLVRLNSASPEGLRGESTIDGTLRGGSGTPVVGTGGIVNAGVAAAFAPLSPGGIFQIYGAALADGLVQGTQQPLPTQLGTTEVLLQGRRLPLLFVSGGQVNAIVPYGTSVNTRLPLVVRRGGAATGIETVTLASAQPAILAANPETGQPHAYSAEGMLIGAGTPARRGGVIVIYCVGLGPVNAAVGDGAPAPASPPASAINPVTATVGGRSAQVLFAGLTPGFAGLYQVNLALAADTPAGAAAPVVLTVAGQSSVPVTIPVE